MTPAYQKLARAYFQKNYVDFDRLLDVLNATGNPERGIEVLLGTYQEPEYPKQVRGYDSNDIWTAVGYDMYANTIEYETEEDDYDWGYVLKDTDVSQLTTENFAQFKVPDEKEKTKFVRVKNGLRKTRRADEKMPLIEWQARRPVVAPADSSTPETA